MGHHPPEDVKASNSLSKFDKFENVLCHCTEATIITV
jgi:hypothetical protein